MGMKTSPFRASYAIWIFLAILTCMRVSSSSVINGHAHDARQLSVGLSLSLGGDNGGTTTGDAGTSSQAADSSTDAPPPPSSTTSTPDASSSTSTPPPPPPTSSSSPPPATSSSSTSTPPPPPPPPVTSSQFFPNSTTTTSSTTVPPRTSTYTEVPLTTQLTITKIVTDSSGHTSTSLEIIPTTTMVPSNDPALANNDNNDASNKGVTSEQKKIIIGVVVSIVGVLSIAGLAGLVWRIWFRGRQDQDAALTGAGEKGGSGSPGFSRNDSLARSNSGEYRARKSPSNMNPSSNF